jgi:leucyl-tRNA---protein transferase
MRSDRLTTDARTGLPLLRGELHACPYVPGRVAREDYALGGEMDGAIYQQLMDGGFRRAGRVFYRPTCPACAACVPIRVPVATFAASRSQRRAQRRNADVQVSTGEPRLDAERYELYQRYQTSRHDPLDESSAASLGRFLYESPLETLEMTYRVHGRLVGVGIVDLCPISLSSVYFFFDPDESRRGLGAFSALCEIEECRRRGLPYWYIGFYVAGCHKMEYKRSFRPAELLATDSTWQPADSLIPPSSPPEPPEFP